MRDLLKAQLAYEPVVEGNVVNASTIVCGGMGGSAFPPRVLSHLGAAPQIVVHRDYGLPASMPEGAHYIAISYSGETAEALSFAQEALDKRLPLSVVTGGGSLLALAKEHNLSYVLVPTGPVPREAILSLVKALLALIGEENLLDVDATKISFDVDGAEQEGEVLSSTLEGAVPLIYTSTRNQVLGDFAKILFNETAKTPAFANVFPELNHNELQGFGMGEVQERNKPFIAVFLRDDSDDMRVKHRMDLTEQILTDAGVRTTRVSLPSQNRTDTFLYAWWLMRTAAQSLAKKYGVDPDATPLIDTLKKNL